MKTTVVAHVAAWARRRGIVTSRRCVLALTGLVLLGTLPAAASAAAPEMRGEWQLTLSNGTESIKGAAIISAEPNASGEFASSSMLVEGAIPGSFTGKLLSETETTVRITTQAYGPFAAGEFTSSSVALHESGGIPSLSGSGTLTSGGKSSSTTLTGTRTKTLKEVEEQREREQREREEAELRENVRGEWSLVLKAGAQTAQGVARITKEANPTNEFASSGALFEGAVPGSFSGILEGSKATVEVTSQAYGSAPASKFKSTTMTTQASGASLSMSGSGSLTISPGTPEEVTVPATLTATRTRNYTELKSLEAQEKREREAREKTEREAREQLEREAREKTEREAREKLEAEAKARLEAEARAKQESEASQKSATSGTGTSAMLAVKPASQGLTVAPSGILSVVLSNANAFVVKGSVTLTMTEGRHTGKTSGTKSSHAKRSSSVQIGKSSFTIPAGGHVSVRIALSKGARAALAHHRTLAVTATVLTQTAAGQHVSKTYKLTLHPPAAHHRH